MGIKERKERHKEDLRQRILDAAKVLFLKEGYEATSIRKIAAAIEFSPTTIYLYYKEKNDILFALQKEGFKLLRSQFAVLEKVDNPFERLKALGRGYLQFAFENPEFYELMFVMKEPLQGLEKGSEEEWEDGRRTYEALEVTVAECQQAGYFTGQNPHTFSIMIWSQVHGIVVLCLQGHLCHVWKKKLTKAEEETFDEIALAGASLESFIRLLECMKS